MGFEGKRPWGTRRASAGHTLHCLDPLMLSIKPNPSSSLQGVSQPHSVKSLKTGRLMQQGTSNLLQLTLKVELITLCPYTTVHSRFSSLLPHSSCGLGFFPDGETQTFMPKRFALTRPRVWPRLPQLRVSSYCQAWKQQAALPQPAVLAVLLRAFPASPALALQAECHLTLQFGNSCLGLLLCWHDEPKMNSGWLR